MQKRLHTIGNYRLTGRVLGKGNFSKVHQASHVVLHAVVALKVVNPSRLREEYVRKNLKREARILSKLDHPCILRLFETIHHRSVHCLVTEEVKGDTLYSYMVSKPDGILENETQTIAYQLFSAVDHMHSRSVVHRDLKSENVMYDRISRKVTIVDFGLGNFWFGGRDLKTLCGSPEYAAPELFTAGRTYGPEVDLWSLGVILYVMATGKLPFNFRGGRNHNVNDRNFFLSQIRQGLTERHIKSLLSYSVDFTRLLIKLLTPDSGERIQMWKALEHPWLIRARKSLGIKNSLNNQPLPFVEQSVVEQMSRMLGASTQEVFDEIKKKPFGNIGGVYNLMCRLKMSSTKTYL